MSFHLSSRLVLIPAVFVLFLGCRTGYLLNQGTEFTSLMSERKPIRKVISSDQSPTDQRKKLQRIQEARRFAESRVGLSVENAYTSFVSIDRPAVAWNITATGPFSVRPLTWSFPFVGTFPYLGFFNRAHAVEYRDDLDLRGYDVHMRPVAAFSTLGWFDDPVFSPMLSSRTPVLINTIFHELVHQTVFLKNHMELNEAIATEIGQLATIEFLRKKHGKKAEIVRWTRRYFQDISRIQSFFLDVRSRLQKTYRGNHDRQTLREEKRRVFMNAKRSFLDLLDRMHTGGWSKLLSISWNNAFVASNAVYFRHTDLIHRLYSVAFDSNLKRTVQFLASLDASHPLKQIKKRLKNPGPGHDQSDDAPAASNTSR